MKFQLGWSVGPLSVKVGVIVCHDRYPLTIALRITSDFSKTVRQTGLSRGRNSRFRSSKCSGPAECEIDNYPADDDKRKDRVLPSMAVTSGPEPAHAPDTEHHRQSPQGDAGTSRDCPDRPKARCEQRNGQVRHEATQT